MDQRRQAGSEDDKAQVYIFNRRMAKKLIPAE
jgi:hypothetical protein